MRSRSGSAIQCSICLLRSLMAEADHLAANQCLSIVGRAPAIDIGLCSLRRPSPVPDSFRFGHLRPDRRLPETPGHFFYDLASELSVQRQACERHLERASPNPSNRTSLGGMADGRLYRE